MKKIRKIKKNKNIDYVPFNYVPGTDLNKIDNLLERYLTERIHVYENSHCLVDSIQFAKELKTKLNLSTGIPLVYQMMNDITVGSRENNSRLKDTLTVRFKTLNFCNINYDYDGKILNVAISGLDKTLPIISMYSRSYNPKYSKLSSITLNRKNGSLVFLT